MKTTNGKRGAKSSPDASENLYKLYNEDLKDIYWAEKHLVKVLPKMAKAASSEELRKALEDHLRQTEGHVARVEEVFAASGLKTAAKRCEGMEGLTKEGEEVLEEFEKSTVRDAGIIVAAQKVEHYEIAAYGSLRNLADVMGLDRAAELLQTTLDEEGEADKLLTSISESVNVQAFEQSGEREPETGKA
jgi:ferritin-like metal-binding protein YciE